MFNNGIYTTPDGDIYKVGDRIKYYKNEGEIISPKDIRIIQAGLSPMSNKYIYVIFDDGSVDGIPPSSFLIVISREKEKSAAKVSGVAPRNNDGRDICFWCDIPTQKRGGGNYDVCPKCGN